MTKITNEQINEIAESMPGGLEGFMKGWGWQQFARKLLGLQEQTILDLQVELAKSEKSRKKWRDRALSAEADAREAIADFGELQAEIKQNEVSKKITYNGNTYKRGVWFEWNGGYDAPVPDGVKHCVMFRSNKLSGISKDASNRYWNHGNDSSDIVAFMIL